MPIHIIREDITKINCDIIVNATNEFMNGTGGVDGAIRYAAGKEFNQDCEMLGSCAIGEAKITKGYKLPCKYVIHTVGPQWVDGKHNEKNLLESCYKNCLDLAKCYQCESIAFPIISSRTYGYPKEEAFKIAVNIIQEFLLKHDMDVYIVVFDKKTTHISKKLFNNVLEYIDDNYIDEYTFNKQRRIAKRMSYEQEIETFDTALPFGFADEFILDESFSECLLRLIDEKGMKDSECYKKANIDRKLFNKIKNNNDYHPKKETVISFALSLELSLKETEELLKKAGYSLSNSYKFDVIIQYFLVNHIYDIITINETLYAFDQKLLSI